MSLVLSPPLLHWATTQSIESSRPAIKPSNDIVTCQITLLTVAPFLHPGQSCSSRLPFLGELSWLSGLLRAVSSFSTDDPQPRRGHRRPSVWSANSPSASASFLA